MQYGPDRTDCRQSLIRQSKTNINQSLNHLSSGLTSSLEHLLDNLRAFTQCYLYSCFTQPYGDDRPSVTYFSPRYFIESSETPAICAIVQELARSGWFYVCTKRLGLEAVPFTLIDSRIVAFDHVQYMYNSIIEYYYGIMLRRL